MTGGMGSVPGVTLTAPAGMDLRRAVLSTDAGGFGTQPERPIRSADKQRAVIATRTATYPLTRRLPTGINPDRAESTAMKASRSEGDM